ncbi:DUF1232 domain-containing protein [bacterium]|nr:DUF1232 domain-containing protein [bacterium]
MNKILNKEKLEQKFKSFSNYTEDDFQKVMENEKKIYNIMKNPKLVEYWEDVKLYFRMLRDIVTRKYRKIPFGTIAVIVCTLLYILNPQDIIPDYIVGIGYIDDAFILSMSLLFTKMDVQKYKDFKVKEEKGDTYHE